MINKLVFPIKSKSILTQGFGMTKFASDGNYGGAIHNGIDLAGFPSGTPISPVADGVIIATGFSYWGWGHWLMIRHNNGLHSFYGHLFSKTGKKVNERVDPFGIIGKTGDSGASTGPHLHLSLFRANPGVSPVGPIDYSELALDPLGHLSLPTTCNTILADLDPARGYKHCMTYLS